MKKCRDYWSFVSLTAANSSHSFNGIYECGVRWRSTVFFNIIYGLTKCVRAERVFYTTGCIS